MLCRLFPGMEEMMYKYGNDEQLKFLPEPYKQVMSTYDARIYVFSDSNTKALSGVDPAKSVIRSQSRSELMKIMMKRSAAGELRWVLGPYPTNALAQDAEMSLTEYEDFVYGACLPDINDPIGYWKRFSAWQQKIVNWLKGKQTIRVVGKETDLRMSIAGRNFENCDGKMNMPDGEVFTGPVEDSMEGHVYFSYPAIYGGREVTGVRLWFEKGEVVKATAEKNQEYLVKTIATDEGSKESGSLPSAPMRESRNSPVRFSSMRKSAAVSIWRWVPDIRRRAVRMNRRFTGIWSATCGTAAKSGWIIRCSTRTASL